MTDDNNTRHTRRKRSRTADDDSAQRKDHPQTIPAINLDTPHGLKVVHINTAEYVAHPNDIVGEPWIPKRTADYIFKIMSYNNPDDNHFPIHLLPNENVQWSVVDLNPLVMHKTYNGRPLLIWIVGTLTHYAHTSTIDEPIPRLTVTIDFLRTRDRNEAIALYNASCSGKIRTMDYLNISSPIKDDDGPASYNQVYDATRSLQSKKNMLDIPLARLEGGDIVLVECTLVRTEDLVGVKNIAFGLHTLYWIAEKPRKPRTKVVPSSCELRTEIVA